MHIFQNSTNLFFKYLFMCKMVTQQNIGCHGNRDILGFPMSFFRFLSALQNVQVISKYKICGNRI